MQLNIYALIAEQILAAYQYPEPLSLFLKKHFKANKKYGSRDRKIIAQIIYDHLRLGKDLDASFMEVYAAFEQLELPYKLEDITLHYQEQLFQERKAVLKNFPRIQQLPSFSEGIDKDDYYVKLSIPAFTFIRVIRDAKRLVQAFIQNKIPFGKIGENTIAIPSKTNMELLQLPESIYTIQDANSQSVCEKIQINPGDSVWDTCAASGGKSLAVLARNIPIELSVSDIRTNILRNLEARFKLYNYKYKRLFQHDAATILAGSEMFNTVICDVPCSGSGTWSRTPEQYYFFTPNLLEEFIETQQKILVNSWNKVKVGGRLYYITCSVFAQENEDQINKFLENTINASLDFSIVMDGKKYNADYMFIACLIKD